MRRTAAATPLPQRSALNRAAPGMPQRAAENPADAQISQRRLSADSVIGAGAVKLMHGATSTRRLASSKRAQLHVRGPSVCGTAVPNLTTASSPSLHLPCAASWLAEWHVCSKSACTSSPLAVARQKTQRALTCRCRRVLFARCASRAWTSRCARL